MANKLILPLSIVIAGGLIALAIIVTLSEKDSGEIRVVDIDYDSTEIESLLDEVGVNGKLLGSPDAKIIIAEYSDTECPFCKRNHETMNEILQKYGTDGTVAWEFKHFPLTSLHKKSTKESQALECVYEVEGGKAFWIALDTIFSTTLGNDGLNLNTLPAIAELSGADRDDFNKCMEEDKHLETIDEHTLEAVAFGGEGTPFSVLHFKEALTEEKVSKLTELDEEIISQQVLFSFGEERTHMTMSGALPFGAIEELIKIIIE